MSRPLLGVMAGLVPAIHVFGNMKVADARSKLALGPAGGRTRVAGHDDGVVGELA